MRKIVVIAVVAVCLVARGQEFKNSNLQSLVDAERAFSSMAKEKNTRDAFIFYFSDSAVTSAPGAGPRVGKSHLQQQQPNDSWLYWYPVYSDISASGDFGFNTGPWEFRQKKTDEKPVAFGEFVSMWKKNSDGEWKVAIDIGIGHGPPAKVVSGVTTSTRPLQQTKRANAKSVERISAVEKAFIDAYNKNGAVAYNTMLSDDVRWFRPGIEPVVGLKNVKDNFTSGPSNVEYALMGGDISSSGDLAYVYGKALFDVTRDGTTQRRTGSYMRFWKKEDGKNWKIVLDLITN